MTKLRYTFAFILVGTITCLMIFLGILAIELYAKYGPIVLLLGGTIATVLMIVVGIRE